MSEPSAAPAPPSWQPLDERERRILGVLVEKQKTSKTADSYPMTLNALTVGANQKSNRDPVMDLTDDDVEEVLTALQKKGLVIRMTGSRVDRFRHTLYETWTKDGRELAVLAELLLRGAQTKGDLRGRASRMTPIDTLDDLDAVLKSLAERKLVVWLAPPDRRGATVTHGFYPADEFAGVKAAAPADADGSPAPRAAGPSTAGAVAELEAKLAAALDEIAKLKAAVAALERRVGGAS